MQRINLYQKEFSTTGSHRSKMMLAALVLVLVLIAVVYMMQLNAIKKLDNQLTKKQSEVATLEKSLEIIRQKSRPAAQDMNLSLELENLRQVNASKKRASNYLQGNDTGNLSGFSMLLEGLGRQRDNVERLWLTKIKISKGGYDLQLNGKSYQANLLPEFISALSDEALYNNREFRQIKITRSESSDNVLNFMLDTRHDKSKQSDGKRYEMVKRFMAMLRQNHEPQNSVHESSVEEVSE